LRVVLVFAINRGLSLEDSMRSFTSLRFLSAFIYLILPAYAVFAEETPGPQIPELNWEARSDWTNVKAGDTPAKGDGVADDTAAIQAALNKMQAGSTIYFPPGTYRITQTLTPPEGRFLGISLLGHGRSSVLVWNGEAGGRMFWSKEGLIVARYVGLTWDGKNKAAVGFDHSNLKYFETEMRHQHEAYRNFTEAGIRVGHQQQVATAETLYENCLFEHCKHGVSIRNFNDLDHTFDGCEFRDCEVGLYGGKGSNFYARNSRFVNSSLTDMVCLGEQGSSVRNCTSQGSKQFMQFGASVSPLVIQNCQISGWTGTTSPIVLHGAPVLIFDTTFSAAEANQGKESAPAVEITSSEQRLIVSNNRTSTGMRLLKEGTQGTVIEVPAGSIKADPAQGEKLFLQSTVRIPGKVFDAKRDFGAKGDGATDDTAAINKAIEAARAHGQGAIAYLPAGQFVVSSTLKLSGKDYYIGGSGYRTALLWRGPVGGTTIEISDPDRLTLENIAVGHHDCGVGENAIDIQQTGTGKPSSMCYDRVWTWGMYQNKPLERGLRVKNLGPQDRVLFREMNGNIHFTDCAAALIYMRLSYEGTILVEGKSPNRGGFIGGAVRLGTVTDPAIWLKDNQSLVISDLYVESSLHHTRLEGDASLPAGRLTMAGAKFELSKPENNGLEVNNYHGEAILGPYQFYVGNPIHHFVQQGDAPFALTMLGSLFYNSQPEFKLAPGSKLEIVGGTTVGLNKDDTVSEQKGKPFADSEVERGLPRIGRALDDLRRLNTVEIVLTDALLGDGK
jgi:hypothetical protein